MTAAGRKAATGPSRLPYIHTTSVAGPRSPALPLARRIDGSRRVATLRPTDLPARPGGAETALRCATGDM